MVAIEHRQKSATATITTTTTATTSQATTTSTNGNNTTLQQQQQSQQQQEQQLPLENKNENEQNSEEQRDEEEEDDEQKQQQKLDSELVVKSSVLSPTSSSSFSSNLSATTTTTSSVPHLPNETTELKQQHVKFATKQQQKEKENANENEKENLNKSQKDLGNKKIANKLKSSNSKMSSEIVNTENANNKRQQQQQHKDDGASAKSAVSQRNVDIKITKKTNADASKKELTKKMLKLDLTGKELDEYSLKSPKSPIAVRLPHQTSLTSSVDVEDRKTLREALYQGIFHRHRRTIFAVGSFLRMLRSRNASYNTIRSSSEGEDIDEVR